MALPIDTITIRRGDTFTGRTYRLNRGTTLAPDYIALTGANILVEFRSVPAAAPALAFTTEGASPTITIGGAGDTEFSLVTRSGEDMDIPAGTYTADVDVLLAGVVKTRFEIALVVSEDYSKRWEGL